jgi:hypothetical protein
MSSPRDLEDYFRRTPYVEDAGFTARTLARLPDHGRRRVVVLAIAFAAAFATALVLAVILAPGLEAVGGWELPVLSDTPRATVASMGFFTGCVAAALGVFFVRARRL